MPEKFTALCKKAFPFLLISLLIILFLFLTRKPDQPETEIPAVSRSLIIETELAETDKETETNPPETKRPQQKATEPPAPPESILLEDVPYYSQKNLLPTGCEIVSAKMVLEYYTQEEADIEEMIDLLNCQYPEEIDGLSYAPHPEDAFIGSPWDESSFGCFAPVIVDTLNTLLPEQYEAVDTTGMELRKLAETYLPQGKPVLIWATINMQKTFPNVGWYLYDQRGRTTDEWFQWLANEHCMVLVGYDEEVYYFQDPYENHGLISFGREISETRYAEIGKYSATVTEKQKPSA